MYIYIYIYNNTIVMMAGQGLRFEAGCLRQPPRGQAPDNNNNNSSDQ